VVGRPKSLDRARTLGVTLSEEQYERVERLAKEMNVSKSEVIRFAIEALDTPLVELKAAYEAQIAVLREEVQTAKQTKTHQTTLNQMLPQIRAAFEKYKRQAANITTTEKLHWLRPRAQQLGVSPLVLLQLLEPQKDVKGIRREIIRRGILNDPHVTNTQQEAKHEE